MVREGTMTPSYSGVSEAVTAAEPRFVVAQVLRETMATPSSAHIATFEECPRPRPRIPNTIRGRKPERTRGM
ncbi:hypothetical protein ACSL103130_10845 [Actinomyces slackii]